jgi:hypothetical protein
LQKEIGHTNIKPTPLAGRVINKTLLRASRLLVTF